MQRDRTPYILIPAVALFAIHPLILHGCSCGHDFTFHILNWLEAARQFAHGNLHPRWAYTPAYNAGEPRFVFYPPLSWTIGAILGLIFPWPWTPILYTWLALTLSGLTLHRLAISFTTPAAALFAAVFYMLNPYMLFTAYERTAYAELLAAAWIPLLLHAILRPNSEGGVTIPRIAIPVALLWLTNAPAAVMSCYTLALLTLIRLIQTKPVTNRASPNRTPTNQGAPCPDSRTWASREGATSQRLHLTATTTLGTLLGLALAAFYLIPAAYQRRYVQIKMAIIQGLRIQDNTLFHHTTIGLTDPAAIADATLHDQVLQTASIIATLLLALTTITLVIAYKRAKNAGAPGPDSRTWASRASATAPAHANPSKTLLPLTILTITLALALTPISLPLWTHLPELSFLQFPWRLLAILAATLSLTLAIALRNLTPHRILTLALMATLVIPAWRIFRQPCDEEDTVPSRVTLFHSTTGSEPTDEYTPLTADNDSLAQTNPPYWLAADANAPAPANAKPGPAPNHFSFKATQPGFLVINLRDYPSWVVASTDPNSMSLNHPNHIPRDDGLIALPIYYPSDYTIDITFTHQPNETIGLIITLVSFLLLITLFIRHRASNRLSS